MSNPQSPAPPSALTCLERVVRLTPTRGDLSPREPGTNGYGGLPVMRGVGAFYELLVRCRGRMPDNRSYLIDIKEIDRAVRDVAAPILLSALNDNHPSPPSVVDRMAPQLAARIGTIFHSVIWRLSPTYSLESRMDRPNLVLLRQRFDFAAAHRLHDHRLSEAENVRAFGKCNNPKGHGHNYQIEPCVEIPANGAGLSLESLEAVTERVILSRFDHKHLNEDTVEFDQRRGGVNPSVENIAKVSYDLLSPALEAAGSRLVSITVWETDRTSATYPG